MSIGAERDSESARKTKVGKLKVSFVIDQQVLRLKISMQDAMAVTVSNAFAQVTHEFLYHCFTQTKSSQFHPSPFRKGTASSAIRH